MHTSTKPCAQGKTEAHSVIHQDVVMKRLTDGQEAVIGHDSIEKECQTAHKVVEEELGQTASKRNNLSSFHKPTPSPLGPLWWILKYP